MWGSLNWASRLTFPVPVGLQRDISHALFSGCLRSGVLLLPIFSAVEIDFGPDRPGAIFLHKEKGRWHDYLIDGKPVVVPLNSLRLMLCMAYVNFISITQVRRDKRSAMPTSRDMHQVGEDRQDVHSCI